MQKFLIINTSKLNNIKHKKQNVIWTVKFKFNLSNILWINFNKRILKVLRSLITKKKFHWFEKFILYSIIYFLTIILYYVILYYTIIRARYMHDTLLYVHDIILYYYTCMILIFLVLRCSFSSCSTNVRIYFIYFKYYTYSDFFSTLSIISNV